MKQPTAVVDVQVQEPALGVINPYALAEQIAGHPINWSQVGDVPRLLEDIFQTPYAQLFDPAFGGPLFTGLEVAGPTQMRRVRPKLLDWKAEPLDNDLKDDVFAAIQRLGDLAKYYRTDDLAGIPVEEVAQLRQGLIQLTLKEPAHVRNRQLKAVLSDALIRGIAFDPQGNGSPGPWSPPSGSWGRRGYFFNKATEFFDPVQGAVANCYFIAALSAVAWAKPYQIKHMTRATGLSQNEYTNFIRFFKPDSGGAVDKEIEVSSTIPLSPSNNFIYARSSETDEIWPAIYEKAFAKLKTGTTSDQPDITATGWGDCVWATAQLTGGKRHYFSTDGRSGSALWDLVRGHSRSRATFEPMTAWTYSSGAASSRGIVYSDANLVASHCYTVLGWEYRNSKRYIVLRNPWGHTEASVQTLSGSVYLYDFSFFRRIDLGPNDGIFAIEADAFQRYFAGLGVVK